MVTPTAIGTSEDNVIYNPECKKCGIYKKVSHVCVPGDGPDYAKVMIIGEAPGKQEDRYSMPFVGQIGQFLRDRILPAAGMARRPISNSTFSILLFRRR